MSALILKSVNHLHKVSKVYLSLAIVGAFAVVAYELLLSEPLAIIITFSSVVSIVTALLLLLLLRLGLIHIGFRKAKLVSEEIVKKYPGLP